MIVMRVTPWDTLGDPFYVTHSPPPTRLDRLRAAVRAYRTAGV